jgi:[ribosomal protein S18]-alanine N-acetyltransferase
MVSIPLIRLAALQDAAAIAEMSRDYIEHGLGWSWTASRVRAAVSDRATNTAVIGGREAILGFGIMHYGDERAHLSLLAVRPDCRQRGLGAHLMDWLEQPAVVAGLECVRVEARADNPRAIAFYRKHGYVESARIASYYRGVVDAVRLEKRLGAPLGLPRPQWLDPWTRT